VAVVGGAKGEARRPEALGGALPRVALKSLSALAREARTCTACDLWKLGTQTVFGEGPKDARVFFVGEQPGDSEDLAGRPFVGPAGKLLDHAMEEAGLVRSETYVTNAVKHFKWEPRGKRRIHKKPNAREIAACRRWLDAELALVGPEIVVCLGATAAQALLGKSFRVTKDRGRLMPFPGGGSVLATVHPSSLLRAPDEETRRRETARFIDDLRVVASALRTPKGRSARASRGAG
jgi:DNA polymerase